jgi:signal transduction histidine kinase
VDPLRVFDRFYKGDASRSHGGSGLGLSIALENARLQGGHLEAAARDGGGACFTFRVPLAPEAS